MLSVLCALAVAARAAFVAVPHFKPMTGIIMISGMAFGPAAGFLTGAVSGFVSNFLFGQGPWTPWQMFAYGVGGFLAGLLARLGILKRGRLGLALFGFFSVALAVGPLLDTSTLFTMSAAITPAAALAVYARHPGQSHPRPGHRPDSGALRPAMLDKLDRLRTKYGMLEDGT